MSSAVATVGSGGVVTALGLQVGTIGLLWTLVRHRVLFRWIPR
jgi:hypothetical protein